VGEIRVGCSGWNYDSWRGRVYPDGLPERRWLEHYATLFDTVEVNATFYRLPTRKAVRGWVDATPPGFLFAVKVSRYLTHMKRLTDVGQGLARFLDRLEPLVGTPKLGPFLWQLPERFHRDNERLAAALDAAPPGRHCFEFRHPSWFDEEVYALLRAHGAALAVGDEPSRPFVEPELTADWTFLRFHRGRRGRRGNYAPTELRSWAGRIRRVARRADVYAYFNNDWEAFAVRNARDLSRLLEIPNARTHQGKSVGSRIS
jgi:uncharacterized protein YecE (DUF72 family)